MYRAFNDRNIRAVLDGTSSVAVSLGRNEERSLESVCNYLPNYQEILRNLTRNGYEIVDFARKSSTNDNIETRNKLLRAMVSNLKERPFASKIYVST